MRLYRIGPEEFLNSYTGLGGSYAEGARWNRPGIPVMYFALTPAVSLLEMANYIPSPRMVPKTYRLATYEFPDTVPVDVMLTKDLPDGWDNYPHKSATQDIGSEWLLKGEKASLLIPSAAVPLAIENILVVNPGYPDVAHITLISIEKKIYSDRIFGG